MKHSEIVKIATKWLKNHDQNILVPNCPIVVTELHTANKTGEIPDVIGFASNTSVVIEVKTSHADFKAESKKAFRKKERLAMGEQRYYCCPTDEINKDEIPLSWGLLYVGGQGKITIIKKSLPFLCNLEAERQILYSILIRRVKCL